MKKVILTIAAVLGIGLIGVFLYFSGKEYVVTISEDEITQKLNQSLPRQESYFVIFQVGLKNPRINLEKGTNRIDGGLDIDLNIKIGTEKESLGGSIDLSGGIRYEKDSADFFLTDPVVENLDVQGVPEKYREKTMEVLTFALTKYFSEQPIYSLSGVDAKKTAARMVLKKFVIEEEAVVVTLGI